METVSNIQGGVNSRLALHYEGLYEESPPLISIGLPVFNGEKYLEESIVALLNQTMSDFEIIISDNASTDETELICRKYVSQDKRVRYYRQDVNIGPANNFLFVLMAASGKYFMWAAADDKWSKEWLSVLIRPLIEEGAGCYAFGVLRFVDEKCEPKAHYGNARYFPFRHRSGWLRTVIYYLYPESFGKANLIYGLFQRSDIKNVLLSGISSHSYADILLLHRIVGQLRLIQLDGACFYKRVHSGNLGGALYLGFPNLKRYFLLLGQLFFSLPYEYVKVTPGLSLKVLLSLLAPVKSFIFLVSLVVRRMRYFFIK